MRAASATDLSGDELQPCAPPHLHHLTAQSSTQLDGIVGSMPPLETLLQNSSMVVNDASRCATAFTLRSTPPKLHTATAAAAAAPTLPLLAPTARLLAFNRDTADADAVPRRGNLGFAQDIFFVASTEVALKVGGLFQNLTEICCALADGGGGGGGIGAEGQGGGGVGKRVHAGPEDIFRAHLYNEGLLDGPYGLRGDTRMLTGVGRSAGKVEWWGPRGGKIHELAEPGAGECTGNSI